MWTSHVDTPLKVLTWCSLHAESVVWHQKRIGQPERCILRFRNPITNQSCVVKAFTLSEAVALAQKIIDQSSGAKVESCYNA